MPRAPRRRPSPRIALLGNTGRIASVLPAFVRETLPGRLLREGTIVIAVRLAEHDEIARLVDRTDQSVIAVILARPEITGATDVLAALHAPRRIGRAVARAVVAPVAIAALNPQITTNLAATDITDQAAAHEADWASDDGSRHGSHGGVSRPVSGARGRG